MPDRNFDLFIREENPLPSEAGNGASSGDDGIVVDPATCQLSVVDLVGRNHHCDRSYTFPGAIDVYPGIEKALALRYGFAFDYGLGAKNSVNNRRVAIDLDFALLRHGLRRSLIAGRLQARQKFVLGLDAAVRID